MAAEHPNVNEAELSRWSQQHLQNLNARTSFEEYLARKIKVLQIWKRCRDHIDLGTLFDDARQNIIGDGKHALPDENNGTEVMINDIQEAAKLNLKCVFEEFIEEKRRHIK